MNSIKRLLVLLVMVGLMFTFTPSTALAGHSGDGGVAATVTAGFLSVSVVGQNLTYGTRDLGAPNNKPLGQIGLDIFFAAFRVENNGTKESTWDIEGGNSEAWTIGPAASNEIYKHSYDDEGNAVGLPISPTSLHVPTLLSPLKAPGDVLGVWLLLDMPTDSAATTEQSLPIFIIATVFGNS